MIYYTKRISHSFHSCQTFTKSLHELEFCTWMKSSMSVVSLASKKIHPFAWCVEQLKGACQELNFIGVPQQHHKLNKIGDCLSAWNFLGYCLARCCGVHGFFFGFTFNTNFKSIFIAKTRKEVVLLPINSKRGGLLFFFQTFSAKYLLESFLMFSCGFRFSKASFRALTSSFTAF